MAIPKAGQRPFAAHIPEAATSPLGAPTPNSPLHGRNLNALFESVNYTHTHTNAQSSTLSAAAAAVVALHKVSRSKEEDGVVACTLECATDFEKQ